MSELPGGGTSERSPRWSADRLVRARKDRVCDRGDLVPIPAGERYVMTQEFGAAGPPRRGAVCLPCWKAEGRPVPLTVAQHAALVASLAPVPEPKGRPEGLEYGTTARTVTAAKSHRCGGHWISAGEQYVLEVAFPGHDAVGAGPPSRLRLCMACWDRPVPPPMVRRVKAKK